VKRVVTLFALAGALVGVVGLVSCVTEKKFPANRHPLDNPAAIKFAIQNPQPYQPLAHPTDKTSRVP
jgi:hypothetical protein